MERNVESASSMDKPSSRGVWENKSVNAKVGVEKTEDPVALVMIGASLCGDRVSEGSMPESGGGKCPVACFDTLSQLLELVWLKGLGIDWICALVVAKESTNESPMFDDAVPSW